MLDEFISNPFFSKDQSTRATISRDAFNSKNAEVMKWAIKVGCAPSGEQLAAMI